jgi:hypothetical protein
MLLAVFAVFFCGAFLVRPLDAAVFAAVLDTLRLAGFEAAALFAFGRVVFLCSERPLSEDFGDDRRVGVCDLDRLIPLVTGLLIRRFKLKG